MKKCMRQSIAFLIVISILLASLVTNNLVFAQNTEYQISAVSTQSEYSNYYGDQLSGLAKELYDAFKKQFITENDNSSYELTLKQPIKFKAEIKNNSFVENEGLLQARKEINIGLQSAADAFLTDHPEAFWIFTVAIGYDAEASYSFSNGWTGYIKQITFTPQEIYAGAFSKISQFDNAVSKTVSEIKQSVADSSDRLELLRKVHDWICKNAFYSVSSTDKEQFHSAGPVFIGNGEVVCEGYAKSFKILCDKLDIPCLLVHGVAETGGVNEAHMWNYVQMSDGKWYLVDVTWDDQLTGIKNTYFLAGFESNGFYEKVKDERIAQGDFSGNGYKEFVYPTLNANGYNTYTHNWSSVYCR